MTQLKLDWLVNGNASLQSKLDLFAQLDIFLVTVAVTFFALVPIAVAAISQQRNSTFVQSEHGRDVVKRAARIILLGSLSYFLALGLWFLFVILDRPCQLGLWFGYVFTALGTILLGWGVFRIGFFMVRHL